MKKFLSLLMMSLLCVTAWAETVTFTFNTVAGIEQLGIAYPTLGNGTNLDGTYTLGGVTMSFTNGGTPTRIWNSLDGPDLRVYKNGGSLTFTADETITSIVFTSANNSIGNLTPSSGELTEGTWTGSATSVTFTAGETTRINTIDVTYGGSTPPQPQTVATPVITFNPAHPYEGDEATCTITCETEGVNIMYALNDGNFQQYSEPFTLTETTTVKAKALLSTPTATDPVESEVAEKTLTFDPTVANISELTKLAHNTYFKMTGEAVVVYVNGGYLYIKDDTGYTLIYNSTLTGIAAGNTISNLKGKVNIYKNLFEVTNATYEFETTEIAVEPIAMTIPNITAENMNQYVVIKGVTLSDVSGRNIKLNDVDGNQFPGYSQNFCNFPEDLEKTYDVTGFVAVFNTTVQIYPVSFDEAVVAEPVITVDPDFGEYLGVQTVHVTVENMPEGAVIVYNFVAEEPTRDGEWQEYDDATGIVVDKSGLLTIALNDATGEEITSIEGEYIITPDFTGIEAISGKAVAGVRYYNVAGVASDKAFDGVNIVVTTYTDGTQCVTKVVK